jgi:hypothetical protein
VVLSAAGLFWSAGGLFAQANLASARNGAKIAQASSSLDKQSRPENLLDEDPTTTWATGKGKTEDQYVIIKLATRRAIDIGAIALNNSVAADHPPEAGLRQFRLAVSTLGTADEDFSQVKLGSCVMGGGRQVFTFSPARAAYVKLSLGGNYGHPDWIELAEVEVFPAGAPPLGSVGTPSVLLLSKAADPSGTPFAAVAESLTKLGAVVNTFPGGEGSRLLSPAALIGFRVAVVLGDPAPTKDDVRALTRYCDRGGALVCALPADPEPLQPLLEALGVSATPAERMGEAVQLLPHWITEGLGAPRLSGPAAALTMDDSTPLAAVGGTRTIALAGQPGGGRVVVLPAEFLGSDGERDAIEFCRRAVLWAAAMEDTGTPNAIEPVRLSGKAVFLDAGSGQTLFTFQQLHQTLTDRGLTIADFPGDPQTFDRSRLGDARLLIAFMPAFTEVVSLDIADWVDTGGALLVLGNADSDVPGLIAVNGFLREFGTAMTLSPSQNLSVAVRAHPATVGILALSRPGEPLGVWCLQGASLAEMGGTPVAVARTFGQGRVIAMDAGFAVDRVEPPADRKKPPPAYGIELADNREFMARCVAWLLGQD